MKSFLLVVCVSVLSLSHVRADDACCESKSATIQAKLQDIDLTCLLAKYEALQNAKTKAEVQLLLGESEPEVSETEVHALQKRIATLTVHAQRVRHELEEMSKEIKKQEAIAAK